MNAKFISLTSYKWMCLAEILRRPENVGKEQTAADAFLAKHGVRLVQAVTDDEETSPDPTTISGEPVEPDPAPTIDAMTKRIDGLETGYRDAKATNMEIMDDVDDLKARVVALESNKVEPPTKQSSERSLTHQQIRNAALRRCFEIGKEYEGNDSASVALDAINGLLGDLGINLEADA